MPRAAHAREMSAGGREPPPAGPRVRAFGSPAVPAAGIAERVEEPRLSHLVELCEVVRILFSIAEDVRHMSLRICHFSSRVKLSGDTSTSSALK